MFHWNVMTGYHRYLSVLVGNKWSHCCHDQHSITISWSIHHSHYFFSVATQYCTPYSLPNHPYWPSLCLAIVSVLITESMDSCCDCPSARVRVILSLWASVATIKKKQLFFDSKKIENLWFCWFQSPACRCLMRCCYADACLLSWLLKYGYDK